MHPDEGVQVEIDVSRMANVWRNISYFPAIAWQYSTLLVGNYLTNFWVVTKKLAAGNSLRAKAGKAVCSRTSRQSLS